MVIGESTYITPKENICGVRMCLELVVPHTHSDVTQKQKYNNKAKLKHFFFLTQTNQITFYFWVKFIFHLVFYIFRQ